MIKNLPEQNIAFRVYANGKDLLGIANVELPELPNMTETIAGTGIAGEYESPALGSFSSMSIKLKWINQTEEFINLENPLIPLQLECRASQQRANQLTGSKIPVPVLITIWGSVKSSSLGSLETGKKGDNETEIEVMRLYHEIGGEQQLLIDKANMIFAVKGVDVLLPVRMNLGLAF